MSRFSRIANLPDFTRSITASTEHHVVKRFLAGLFAASFMLNASAANVAPTVTITTPAANTSFVALAKVAVTVDAVDSDGAIAKVEYYNGATRIVTITAAPFSLNWHNVAAGEYSITAKAFDNLGAATVSAPVLVSVKANIAPSVTLSAPVADSQFIAPANVQLKAVASDTDGVVKRVTFYRDATAISYSDIAPYAVTWTNAPAGTYSITARAVDDKGAVSISPPVMIDVKANSLPTVAISTPVSGASFAAPGAVVLKATAADADGTITGVTYYNGTNYLGASTTPPFMHTWSNAPVGDYSITAKAVDNKGGVTFSSPVLVSVKPNTAPAVSIISPAANAVLTGPATMMLKVAASDSDGSIAKVVYFHDGVFMGTVTSAPFDFTATNQSVGSYSLVAHAYDDKGAVTISAPVAVTVKQNAGPTVAISAPANNSAFYPGTLTLTADAADSDGTVAEVKFYNGTNLIGTSTSVPFSVSWPNVAPGSYSVRAIAIDDKGMISSSAPVNITIQSAPLPVVAIASPANSTSFAAPAHITLTASASVQGDTITKVDYVSGGNVIGTATAPPYAVILNDVAAGSYEIVARATGSYGGSANSQAITLQVLANAAPAISLTVDPVSGTAPAAITLSAAASDADGSIAMVEFFNGDALLGTATQAPYTFAWNDVAAGTYQLTARATDNAGATSTTAPQTLTVNPPATAGASGIYFIYTDQINTAREIVNAAGTKVWEADPEPFGANMPNQNPGGQGEFIYNPRFPGQYFDKETGLHYNYFRDYDPQTGRYVQSDPIGLKGGINTYGYVSGNPLWYTDPLGLFELPSLPQGVVDFSAGMGDTIWFGQGQRLRDLFDVNGGVDECSPEYSNGEWAGMAASAATGVLGGLRAAGARGAGMEFSHWIPKRAGSIFRSHNRMNGNYVPIATHAVSDPYRYRMMPRAWKAANPPMGQAMSQWTRLPNVYKGGAAGAAAGAAGAGLAGCECRR